MQKHPRAQCLLTLDRSSAWITGSLLSLPFPQLSIKSISLSCSHRLYQRLLQHHSTLGWDSPTGFQSWRGNSMIRSLHKIPLLKQQQPKHVKFTLLLAKLFLLLHWRSSWNSEFLLDLTSPNLGTCWNSKMTLYVIKSRTNVRRWNKVF